MEKDINKDTNIIYIGQKPFGAYLTASTMQLEKNSTIIIKSRGKFTAKAIDIAEVLKQKYNVTIDDIKTNSETFTREPTTPEEQPRDIRVSTIEIVISKK